jgi:hypothetical protein
MKKFLILLLILTLLLFTNICFGASTVVSLKATWTAPTTNSDGTTLTDLTSYNFYRTDGTRTKVNTSPIPTTSGTTTSPYLFSETLTSTTTMSFVITAVNSAGKESVDSTPATYTYTVTTTASPPTSLTVTPAP